MKTRKGQNDFESSSLLSDFLNEETIISGSYTAYFNPTSTSLRLPLQKVNREFGMARLKHSLVFPPSPSLLPANTFNLSLTEFGFDHGLKLINSEDCSLDGGSNKKTILMKMMKSDNPTHRLVRLDVHQFEELEILSSTVANVKDFKPNSLRYFKLMIGTSSTEANKLTTLLRSTLC